MLGSVILSELSRTLKKIIDKKTSKIHLKNQRCLKSRYYTVKFSGRKKLKYQLPQKKFKCFNVVIPILKRSDRT